MESDREELCLIDSAISSMLDLPIGRRLSILNLHSNQISRIENLRTALNLHHLDLSSNAIEHIEGLESLVNLRTLNLSCNAIRHVRGTCLARLRSLARINLSYNRIAKIDGFLEMSGDGYCLSHADLRGNALGSLEHITHSLSGCRNLRGLALSQDGDASANRLCDRADYAAQIFTALPWLIAVDGRDMLGLSVVGDEVGAVDIPGLDQYAEYLTSSTSTAAPETGAVARATPKIDALLDAFKRQCAAEASDPTSASSVGNRNSRDTSAADARSQAGNSQELDGAYGKRLEALEQQISGLLNRGERFVHRQTSRSAVDGVLKNAVPVRNSTSSAAEGRKVTIKPKVVRHSAKRDVDDTAESGNASTDEPLEISQNAVDCDNRTKRSTTEKRNGNSPARGRAKTSQRAMLRTEAAKQNTSKSRSPSERSLSPNRHHSTNVADLDVQRRKDLQTTYFELMRQLEEERERRWKAEQAARKLAETLQLNVSRLREEQSMQGTTTDAIAHLKQILTAEREARIRLQAEKEQLEQDVRDAVAKCEEETVAHDELKNILKTKDESAARMEQEFLKQQSVLSRKAQDSQLKSAALTRELEIISSQSTNLKTQLQHMQELLANREQDHRREMEGRFSVGSKEFQEQLEKELVKHEKGYALEKRALREERESMERKYCELEDEFRLALYTEADRFRELQAAYKKMSTESAREAQMLGVLQRKDVESAAIVSELTSLVKEQKVRLTEQARSRSEQTRDLKERVTELELHLDEARRRMVQLELLKQDKARLTAQVGAQTSLIEGLRAEKGLWGEELAKQSSALSQDRGRLEAKIETLQNEMTTLKRQLEAETDAVRIKSKVIDDQNETVRRLKDALLERDNEVRVAREEALLAQRVGEEQLASETSENARLAEQLAREQARRDELKGEVVALRRELEQVGEGAAQLETRLKAYARVEQQVEQMKEAWEQTRRSLTSERDAAVSAAKSAVERLRAVDDAFRKQLDDKESFHQRALTELVAGKDAEVAVATARVSDVENEMRTLLKETEAAKRATEERIRRLTRAFTELQQDMA